MWTVRNIVTCLLLALPICVGHSQAQDLFFEGGPCFYDLLSSGPDRDKSSRSTLPGRQEVMKNIAQWMDAYQKRGVNLFTIPLFDREGVTICNSRALKSAGFRYIQGIGDIFPLVALAAKTRKISLSVPIDELFHIINGSKPYKEWLDPLKLTPDCIGLFIKELGEYSRSYQVGIWISELGFGPRYVQIISKSCRQNNIRYLKYSGDWHGVSEIFCSEDYATYPPDPENSAADRRYLTDLVNWGAADGRIGYLNMMFGLANHFHKKTAVLTAGGWGLVPGCQRNVALYRAVQFAPCAYCFCAAFYSEAPYENEQDVRYVQSCDYRQLTPDLEKFCRDRKNFRKPIANIIVDPPDPPFNKRGMDIFESALASSMAAITNAITAAGFELYVSIKRPQPGADVYYIFTAGSSPELNLYRDISSELLALFPSRRQVYLQCSLGIPRGPNWRKLAPFFGLPPQNTPLAGKSDASSRSPIPGTVEVEFPTGKHTVKFRGYQFSIEKGKAFANRVDDHHLSDLSFKDLASGSRILVLGQMPDKVVPLVIRYQHCTFINGNFLHLDFSSILANLLALRAIFMKPALVYLTVGQRQSAILSAADTRIDLWLPQKSTAQIYHWHSDGRLNLHTKLLRKGQRLQGPVQKWELVICR